MPVLKQTFENRVFMMDADGSGKLASCVRALDGPSLNLAKCKRLPIVRD